MGNRIYDLSQLRQNDKNVQITRTTVYVGVARGARKKKQGPKQGDSKTKWITSMKEKNSLFATS